MKRNVIAVLLAVVMVATVIFVAAPATKAATVYVADTDDAVISVSAGDTVDLNGKKNVTVNVADGGAVILVDTGFMLENGELDLTGENAGTATVNGTVESWAQYGDYKYLAVEKEGKYSAHPFNLTITKYGVNPTTNKIAVRATFIANNVVRGMITDLGIVNGKGDVAASQYLFGNKNGIHVYFDINDSLKAENLDKTASLNTYITLENGTTICNLQAFSITPAEVLARVNAEYPTYTGNLKEKADLLYSNNATLQEQYLSNLNPAVYNITNGGFENGLEGWNVVGNIGNVSGDRYYWVGDGENPAGYDFQMDGEKMFSAYAPGAEERAVGTLTSSTFKVGASGFITFKVGAMKDGNYVYIDVVDANTKEILARYYNGLWTNRTEGETGALCGCTMIAYKADLSAFRGKDVFLRISDNADSGYGLFFVDSFVTHYDEEPEGFNNATPVDYAVSGTIYDLFNGGFEMGNVQGWWSIGEIGLVTNANGYWGDNIPYQKDGKYLFTGVESNGADTMREGNRGTLTSSVFEIGGSGSISFKLGGGGNEQCYVQVIDAVTNEVLARYRQQAMQDAVLIQYVADLSAHIGKTARIQVVDYASGGWGCVSFDSVKTYYATTAELPAGLTASNIFHGVYNVANGSFESGLDGWHMNITEGGAHNTLGWVVDRERWEGWYSTNEDRKDGNCLFTFYHPDGVNCENTKGTLESSVFTLKSNTYVSFRFGGAGTRDVHIQLCRADGSVIATFFNEAPGKANTEMFAYYYYYTGETADCFFRVVDNSVANYGCFVVDDFRANLATAPEGFIEAIR